MMTRNELHREHLPIASIHTENCDAKVISHPAIHSMGQVLAGQGQLVFEGELLDTPLSWHPTDIKH